MAQKKKTRKTSPWFILAVLIIAFLYYQFIGFDNVEENKTKYQAITEISENIESRLDIYYWDVGQADSILIGSNNEYMLIDAGNNADGKLIVNQLNEMGIKKIKYLVGTHPHEDHIGGLDDIIKNFKIGKILMPNRQSDSVTFEKVLDAAIEKDLKISTPKEKTKFKLGNVECIVLSAKSDAEDTNDASIVIQVNFGKNKFLFTGDITSIIEEGVEWEDIDVLKVAHHGSRYSSSKEFLDQTKPEIAIISVGEINDYDHPHAEALNRLKNAKTKVYRTDKKGTIHIATDGKAIGIEFLKISLDGNRK